MTAEILLGFMIAKESFNIGIQHLKQVFSKVP